MTRRTVTAIATAAACCALTVVAVSGPLPPIDLPQDQVAALSGIDVRIGKEQIEAAFGPLPLDDLIDVARDIEEDPGMRLRAYRAIGLYKTAQSRNALRFDINNSLGSPQNGIDLLYLRAAIEALAQQQDPEDIGIVAQFLDFEASRDIRAAAADALRTIQSTFAIPPLKARNYCTPAPVVCRETVKQVQLAINRALRALGEPE